MAGGIRRSFFIFLLHLLVLTVCSSGTLVGFSWEARREGVISSAIETISFIKNNKASASQIRVSVSDPGVLDSLSKTGLDIGLYLNEAQIENLRNSKTSAAISLLKTHLATVLLRVNITSIVVGCSHDSSVALVQLPSILPILRSIHSVLRCFKLERKVKVSVAFSMSSLQNICKKQARDIRGIVDFIKKSNSFIVIESQIQGELIMGDQFVQLMIETATKVTAALPCIDAPMVVIVHTTAVPSAVEVAEFSSKILRSVENNTRILGLDGLFVEISSMKESEREVVKWEGHIFPSFHRELLNNINDQRLLSAAKTTTIHDLIYPPPAIFPTTPITNPTTTPAATIPTTNPTPTITVPSTNPVTVMPTNPATTPVSPVTVPSTTPVTTIPYTNPIDPPTTAGQINNPVADPMTPPVTNPVTVYPVMPPSPSSIPITTPVTTPPANPVMPTPATGQTWCVAKTGVSDSALQAALDYACGIGGADCSTIQQTGSCFNPNTLQNHASYAFNSYYQKNPLPTSCNFGGTAMMVDTNPSIDSCVYPSSSPAAATTTYGSVSPPSVLNASPPPVLNASNPGSSLPVLNTSYPGSGTTTIFGTEAPPGVSPSVSISARLEPLFGTIVLLVTSIITGSLVTAV
ncbi:G8 domain-containing protein DDB_G0286311-like [Telopea speciosissima]|uniref:G8 domain-containing protein DDB_G0286311-like n=1 Tax=Telopea speciosissima TaxID=54955 RepID=UPI001CC81784|nr:G8 domain-containing protein DDB_G0286311-like [Telopea speciosissima]